MRADRQAILLRSLARARGVAHFSRHRHASHPRQTKPRQTPQACPEAFPPYESFASPRRPNLTERLLGDLRRSRIGMPCSHPLKNRNCLRRSDMLEQHNRARPWSTSS